MESEFCEINLRVKLIWYNASGCSPNNSFMVIKDGDLYENVVNNDSEEGSSIINCYDWSGKNQASYIVNKKLEYIAYSGGGRCPLCNQLCR